MPPVKTGVEAFWDNTDFQKGFGQFMKGIGEAIKGMEGAGAPAKTLGGSLSGMFGGANAAAGAVGTLGAAAVAGGMFIVKLAESLWDAAKAAVNLAKDSIMTAARVQELTLVAQLLGQRAGYSSTQINEQTQAIKNLGIRTDVALGLQAQFARYNLDMAKATDLARVAQDAAVLSMEDSSSALDGLMYGIITYNQRILRTHGLNVDLSNAFKEYAATLGKTSEQLSEQEKVQATLNAVIAEGGRINGVYATAMEAPGKQARSLSRLFYELKLAIGQPFLNAFGNIVKAIATLVKAFTTAVSEGGKLYPVLQTLGAIAEVVSVGIKSLAETISGWLTGAATEAQNKITGIANDAIQWGINIAVNLATGLIQGAASAITAALNWLSQLLSSWLKPGSPPKVAPNIDKYGAATMDEYLKGFTKADFAALDVIQNQMKSVFSQLVDEGTMEKDRMGKIFARLSKDIIKALSTGQVDEALFNKIRQAGGEYGDELADLARKQIELAQAEGQVKAAEEALAAAKERSAQAGKEVNLATMQYNRMLRGGATKEELEAQRAKINAAAEAKRQADAEAASAEDNLDSAKENLDVLREQAELQQELLSQLLEIAQATTEQPKPETPGAPGGGGPTEPTTPEFPDTGLPDLGGVVDNAVASIRQKILEGLGNIWDELVELWKTKIEPALAPVIAAWERLKTAAAPIVDWIKARWADFLNWLRNFIPNTLDNAKNWWSEHGKNVVRIAVWLWNQVKRTVTNVWNFLKMVWTRYGGDILRIAKDVWDLIVGIVSRGFENVGYVIDIIGGLISGDWASVWNGIKGLAMNVWENIKGLWKLFLDVLKLAWKVVLDYLKWYWSSVWNGIVTVATAIWNGIKTAAEAIWNAIVSAITTVVNTIGAALETAWNAISSVASSVWNAIAGFFTTVWATITTTFNTVIESIKTALSDAWDAIKATVETVWGGIKTFLEGLINGLFTWMGTSLDEQKTLWGDRLDKIKLIVETVWTRIKDFITQKFTEAKDFVVTNIGILKDKMGEIWDGIKTKAEEIWNGLSTTATTVWDTIKGTITTAVDGVKTWLDTTWGNIQTAAETAWGLISGAATRLWTGIQDAIATPITTVLNWLSTQWGTIKTNAETLWGNIKDAISGIAQGIVDEVERIIGGLLGVGGTLANFASDMVGAGKDLIQGLINGVGQMAGALLSAVGKLVDDAIDYILDKLGVPHSPSWITIGAGKDVMLGLEKGLKMYSDLPKKAMAESVDKIFSPIPAPVPVMGGNNYRTLNMTNNIYPSNRMDVYALESMIERVVVKAMRR